VFIDALILLPVLGLGMLLIVLMAAWCGCRLSSGARGLHMKRSSGSGIIISMRRIG
jgi:hypothetical protein